MPTPDPSAASYLCGECGDTDRGPIEELIPRMTDHWRGHRDEDRMVAMHRV